MAALLALAGAFGWGVGDFLGGIAARRLPVLTVLLVSQAVGLLGVSLWVLASGDPFPGVGELLPAAAAGITAMVGLAALYRGFAIGAMGIVAPISAASPIVPLAADAAAGLVPSPMQWMGIALVVTGIVALSREPSMRGRPRFAAGVGLALVAALGFGLFFLGIDAGADESTAWAVAAARGISVPIVLIAALATRANLRPDRRLLPMLVGSASSTRRPTSSWRPPRPRAQSASSPSSAVSIRSRRSFSRGSSSANVSGRRSGSAERWRSPAPRSSLPARR